MQLLRLLTRRFPLILLLSQLEGQGFATTQELLTNGGFEPPYNAVSGTNSGGTVSGNFPSGWLDNSRTQGKQTNNTYSEETSGTVSGSAFKSVLATDPGANPVAIVQIYQKMNFAAGRTLTASVWMKSSIASTVSASFLLDVTPFTARKSQNFSVTTSWQQFTVIFTPTITEPGRLMLTCNNQPITLWMDEASITVDSGGAPVIVSSSGSDTTGSGTLAAPYQTIAKGMASVFPGDTVQLRAGIYRETITPTQSGTASAPITITNYNGEAVTVTGADVVAGPWTAGSNGVYTADVGVDLGEGFNQFFVDGAMVHEAREPNYGSGDLMHPATASMTVTATATQSADLAKVDSSITTTLTSKPDNFYVGARLHAGIQRKWAWQGGTIASSTGSTLTLTAAAETGSWWFLGSGSGYLFGLPSLLDSDNEWFLQHNATAPHTLALRITGQADPTGHLVEVRNRTYTINYNSKNYIKVTGLNLRCGDVQMNGTGDVLDHCDLSYLSHFLPFTSSGTTVGGVLAYGTNDLVRYCTIHDTAGCGLQLRGTGNLITRNQIYNTDYSATYSAGIAFTGANANSQGDTVTFNTVHHTGRDGIFLAGGTSGGIEFTQGGHLIAYNDVYEPGQLCKDLACIYTFSSNAQGATGNATRIAYNWCHDQTVPTGLRILIYLDNWDRNYVVDHNVCWNGTGDAGVRMNGPNAGHKVYHNTLYNCDDANTHTFTTTDYSGSPEPTFFFAGATYAAPDIRNNLYLNTTPDTQLTNSAIRDFRPKAGAAAIDSATLISGYNDSFTGAAPDKGAYEAGGAYWVPGVNGWAIDQPGITSSAASSVTGTTATANGTLISAGTAATTVVLYWGTSDGGSVPGAWANVTTLGTAYTGTYQALSSPLTGLTPATLYWFRYRATNANGDTWSEPQSFTIPDTTPPTVTAPANVTVQATSSAGALVNYNAATASDDVGVVSLTYSKASGTLFPLGVTTVTVSATDAANNVGTATFTVTVTPLPTLNFAAGNQAQDSFDGTAGVITSRVPGTDLRRQGWTVASAPTALSLSGDGRLISPDQTAGHLAALALLPTSPFAVITLTATIELPVGDANWIGFGLADGVHSLTTDQSGPWVEVHGTGLINLYGGSGTNSAHSQTVSYGGGPVQVVLTYNAYASTMSLNFGGTTVFTDVAVAHTPGVVSTNDAVIEFAPNAGQPAAFAVDDFSVDVAPRPKPILTLPTTDTILVGASNGTDDTSTIQNALAAAKTLAQTPGKVVELRFDAAQYKINSQFPVGSGGPPVASGCAVQLTGATNVWVNGNGAEILITNPTIAFLRLFQCTNCIVQGFTVDYDPLPWTEGDVVTTNNGGGTNVVIDVRAGYPNPSSALFVNAPKRWAYMTDPAHPGRLRDNSDSSYDTGTASIIDISDAQHPSRFQIPLTDATRVSTIHVGDRWIQQARYGGILFNPVQCNKVSFIGITNYAGTGPNFGGSFNQLLGVVNCQVLIKAGRSKSTDADGVLQQSNRIAPWIEGCTFEGLADDMANFNTFPYVILQTDVGGDPTAYKVGNFSNGTTSVNFSAVEFSIGDQLSFLNPQDGAVFSRATVVSVDQPNQVLKLSAVIPNVVAGATQTATSIYNDSLNSSGVIVNNQFLNSRRFGAYCKASFSLIADNTFTGLSESAIVATNELVSLVGGAFPSNLLITRNVFSEIGNDFFAVTSAGINATPVYPSISLHKIKNNGGTTGDNYVTAGREFTGIHILGNTFDSWRRAAVRLMNCDGVEIIGNTFGQPKTDFAAPTPGNRLVDLHYSDNIVIANNVASAVPSGVATLLQTHCTGVQTASAFVSSSPLSIASNNTNPAWAKLNNTVTLSFTATTTPTVTLLGVSPTLTHLSGDNWTATATVVAGTASGIATFSINGTDPGATTDGSNVIVDKVLPVLTVQGSTSAPANITTEATSAAGTAVTFTSNAMDTYDPSPTVVSTPASGNTFPLGTTTVSTTATDAAGNVKTLSFTVTVQDTTAPSISGTFSPLTLTTGAGGTVALPNYTGQAVTSDAVGVTSVTQLPVPGAAQSVGTTHVTLTAFDGAGNSASTSFDVVVNDGTPPVLTLPSNITAEATSAAGAVVTFAASATDNVGTPNVVAIPASGSTFVLGTTTVNVSATDAAGNVTSGSFTVTVQDTTPIVALTDVTGVTTTAATLNGTVNANGHATTAQFQYGANVSYGSTAIATLSPNNGSTALAVSAALGGLQPGMTYHYRLTATNSSGSNSTSDATFTTNAAAPAVTRGTVTIIGANTATLNGTVNPNGAAATAQFQYGLTTSYASSAAIALSPPDGTNVQAASLVLTGLQPTTLYHYRVSATNSLGTTNTTDGTFTTQATQYYVATNGSNSNAGTTLAAPFLTIQKGIDAVKYSPGATVFIRGGTYREDVEFNGNANAGGAPGNYVNVFAYPGETPVLKGSQIVTGWALHSGSIWKKTAWTINSQQVFVDFDTASDKHPLQQIGRRGSLPLSGNQQHYQELHAVEQWQHRGERSGL